MGKIRHSLFSGKKFLHGCIWLLMSFVVLAATVVTATQVANAIRNSVFASDWLKANADAVGRLAMFESGGRLDVYNNSCCTGVLQLTKSNILEYAKVSPEVFQTWGLQDQVDVWSKLTTNALKNSAPKTLVAMGTFDGREVGGDMVLACVQLGIGNCQKMINSGSCSGFADINGTTICAMADRILGKTGSGSGTSSGGTTTSNPDWASTGTYKPSYDPCIRDANGGCLSVTAAIEKGFSDGSGVPMADMRRFIIIATVSLTLLFAIYLMNGIWRNYVTGVIDQAELIWYTKKVGLIVLTIFAVISLA